MTMTELPTPKARTSAERMKEQLGVIILTTFGIIQGAVLADLAVVVANGYRDFTSAQWLMVLAAFGLIIVVWSHTVAESLALSWIPNFPDIVAPFVAGAMELYLNHALLVGHSPWLAGAVAISFFLVVAYPIIEGLASTEPENSEIMEHLRPQRRFGLRLAIGGLALNAALFIASLFSGGDLSRLTNLGSVLLTFAWVAVTLAHEARYFGWVNLYARQGK